MEKIKKNKSGKLFISGGGGAQDSFLLDKEFVKSLDDKKILYIPIALQRDSLGHEACYDWIVSALSSHSNDFIEIIMWLDLKNKTIDDLKNFDAVYIGGGNTYKLLQMIYEANFDKALTEFLRRGGNIYGGSAGAIIMGKNISIVNEENDANYKYEKGLSLLRNYSLICHYKELKDYKIKKYIEINKNPVIALTEKSGLIIENNLAKVSGYEPVIIFNEKIEKRIIMPEEKFHVF